MKMVVCSIHGPERETETAVRAALAAGAGGATRSLTKRELIDASGRSGSAREVTDIVMVKSVLPQVLQAITESGLYGQDGFEEVSTSAPQAATTPQGKTAVGRRTDGGQPRYTLAFFRL
jgi:hypothetical protein